MAFLAKLSQIFPRILRKGLKMQRATDLASLEKIIGYRFKKPELLQAALTHSSHVGRTSALAATSALEVSAGGASGKSAQVGAAKNAPREGKAARLAKRMLPRKKKAVVNVCSDNQRLEFLGDAVLSLVIAEALYSETDVNEGLLTEARSRVSCGKHLAQVGRELGLGRLLRVANNGDTARIRESDSANEDALEALFGAVFLDGGIHSARRLARRLFSDELHFNAANVLQGRSAKNQLQELIQKDGHPNDGKRIEYRTRATAESTGPSFQIEVFVDGILRGYGEGKNKRAASEAAARDALVQLRK